MSSHYRGQLYFGGEVPRHHHFPKFTERLNVIGLMKSIRESVAWRLNMLWPARVNANAASNTPQINNLMFKSRMQAKERAPALSLLTQIKASR
jgi:hypothetical protein